MKPGCGSVPPTPSGNVSFDFNQLNQEHVQQAWTSYEDPNLLQGFESTTDLQQETYLDDQSDSSTDSDSSTKLDMAINDPKIFEKMDKLLDKFLKRNPMKYFNMIKEKLILISQSQDDVQLQLESINPSNSELSQNKLNLQHGAPSTLLEKHTFKSFSLEINPKSTFEAINNPITHCSIQPHLCRIKMYYR